MTTSRTFNSEMPCLCPRPAKFIRPATALFCHQAAKDATGCVCDVLAPDYAEILHLQHTAVKYMCEKERSNYCFWMKTVQKVTQQKLGATLELQQKTTD